jgi:hypothetical protein
LNGDATKYNVGFSLVFATNHFLRTCANSKVFIYSPGLENGCSGYTRCATPYHTGPNYDEKSGYSENIETRNADERDMLIIRGIRLRSDCNSRKFSALPGLFICGPAALCLSGNSTGLVWKINTAKE